MRVAIIGAGVAGLACAARLAANGHTVTVLEANSEPGGKITELRVGGYRFDAGPSLLTLPSELDDVFRAAGREPRAYYDYERLRTCCHYFFPDGVRLHAHADPERFAEEVESVLGEPKRLVLDYLDHARSLYEATAPVFIEASLHRAATYASLAAVKALVKLPRAGVWSSMHRINRSWFRDPRLIQLFDRYATYNGSDPYRAPGVLTQIPHLEHNLGAYFPRGGMVTIPRALARLGADLGVQFLFDTPVRRLEHQAGRVNAVRSDRETIRADAVVCAGDVVHAYQKLLPDLTPPTGVCDQERSSSAVVFYWGVQGSFSELDVHNIFFSEDYGKEFADIFERRTAPTDPTIYVHVSSKVEEHDAPPGKENWFVMVNVAANDGQDWPLLVARLRQRIIERLSKTLGVTLAKLIQTELMLDPCSLEKRTASFMGALYGASSNHWRSAFLRHPQVSRNIDGLYFCGGTVHPGGGIPLCLASAKIVASEVLSAVPTQVDVQSLLAP